MIIIHNYSRHFTTYYNLKYIKRYVYTIYIIVFWNVSFICCTPPSQCRGGRVWTKTQQKWCYDRNISYNQKDTWLFLRFANLSVLRASVCFSRVTACLPTCRAGGSNQSNMTGWKCLYLVWFLRNYSLSLLNFYIWFTPTSESLCNGSNVDMMNS